MKSVWTFVGLVFVVIAVSSLLAPASAVYGWVDDDDYDDYYIFWVSAYAKGFDVNDHFSNYRHDWEHGPGSDPPPPFIFCYYDHEYNRDYDEEGFLKMVETRAEGEIYLKTGEYVIGIEARARVVAEDQ